MNWSNLVIFNERRNKVGRKTGNKIVQGSAHQLQSAELHNFFCFLSEFERLREHLWKLIVICEQYLLDVDHEHQVKLNYLPIQSVFLAFILFS